MQNSRFFFIAILFLILSSFFWEDEEKQLRQLYQTAEASWQAKNLEDAKEAYEKILNKIDVAPTQKYQVDWITYVDIVLRYTEAAGSLDKVEDAQKAFSKLMLKNPPKEFLPRIRLAVAKCTLKEKSPEAAYKEMKEIAHLFPDFFWKKEDLSFFHALEYALDSHYDTLYQKASRLFSCHEYLEAASLFEEILSSIENETYPKASASSLLVKKIKLKCAQCYFNQAKYEKSLTLCQTQSQEDKIDCEMIYLSALSFQKKQEYEKALQLFEQYIQSHDEKELEHYDHALFEIGLFFYKSQNFSESKKYLERLVANYKDKKRKPVILGGFFLSKIYLRENLPEKVVSLLLEIAPHLQEKDPLQFECHYLRGEAAFKLGKFEEAKSFFEKSIPPSIGGSPKWAPEALYYLGFCHLFQGDDVSLDLEERKVFFQKSEEIFKKLLLTEKSEEARLALGRLYLVMKTHFDENADKKIESLIDSSFEAMSVSNKLEALLLKAVASTSYEEKEKLFIQATSSVYQEAPSYALAWHLRGLNHFEEGLKKEGPFFELAIFSFEKAFHLYEKLDPKQAALTLKLEAKANFYRNAPLSSLALLEKLLSQFQEDSKEKEESLYLKGLIAAELSDFSHFQIAEQAFSQLILEFPKGAFIENSLHMLGRLYYSHEKFKEAKETFLKLIKDHPRSSFVEESYFWAAEAAEKLCEDFSEYRKKIYELYPNSLRAPEAYFREYPYNSYFSGDPVAIAHLKEFSSRFQNSPLLVVVHYLMGINEKNFEKAKKSFEDAEAAFSLDFEKDLGVIYFRYLAKLELAQLYLWEKKEQKRSNLLDVACSFSHEPEETGIAFDDEINEASLESLGKCLSIVSSIVEDFSNPHHALASLLKSKTGYPPIFEESEFTLALCFLKLNKPQKAAERFLTMLEHYEAAGIDKGFFLSAVWKEQGKLAGRAKNFDAALRCLKIAEECGQGYLTFERKLKLWVLQSSCYREKGEFGLAMRLLSNVINSDIASPLRLKAMFLRAEIYELQGRHELAIRQLEWAAKKGDLASQEKLRVRYGL